MKNEEVDQLAGRLTERKGKFGILVYRTGNDRQELLTRCKDFLEDKKYILPLDDNDLIRLLEIRQENADEDIMNFLDNRFQELILE